MVVAKQGASVPLGRRSDYNILPPPRGVSAFLRRRRHERSSGSNLVVESAAEAADAAADAADAAADAAVAADRAAAGVPTSEVPTAEVPIQPGPVTDTGPRLRRRRQVEADPELPTDLSDMARVGRSQMAADRRRQDDLLGREDEAD
jgi:hypothetical protein